MMQIFFSAWHLIFNFVYGDYWNTEILNFNASKLVNVFTLAFVYWGSVWKKAGYEQIAKWFEIYFTSPDKIRKQK